MTHIKMESEREYDFEEMCPECETYIPVVIDNDDLETYAVTCPTCGREMMLCTLCHWDAHDEGHDEGCDWCQERGCWRGRKEKPWWEQDIDRRDYILNGLEARGYDLWMGDVVDI